MVQGVGVSAGSTTLAALLLRPGLPGTPPETAAAAPAPRDRGAPDRVELSIHTRQSADQAEHAVRTLEDDGARWSAAAFGWLLHRRLLALRAAGLDQAFGPVSPAPSAPPRGGAVDLAA